MIVTAILWGIGVEEKPKLIFIETIKRVKFILLNTSRQKQKNKQKLRSEILRKSGLQYSHLKIASFVICCPMMC